jgi:hypothetical protein
MAYLPPGTRSLALSTGPVPTRLILLGGLPLNEEILMWWNFVARSHDEVVAFREQWQAGSDRFGEVEGYVGATQHLPAPPLPNARIQPRLHPPGPGDRSAWG